MTVRLGMNSVMALNNGTVAVPVWLEIGNATGRSFDMSKDTADITTFDNDGWKAEVGTLKAGKVSFDMLWDTDSEVFAVVQKAFMDNTPVEMMILDRGILEDGSEGLHSAMSVNNFSQDASLPDAMKATVELSVTQMTGVGTFWQRTYTTATGFTPAVGDPCYYDSGTGTVSATSSDEFVGNAVYAALADAPVMVDINATAP